MSEALASTVDNDKPFFDGGRVVSPCEVYQVSDKSALMKKEDICPGREKSNRLISEMSALVNKVKEDVCMDREKILQELRR